MDQDESDSMIVFSLLSAYTVIQAVWQRMFSFESSDQVISKNAFDGLIKQIQKLFCYTMTTKSRE